MTARRIEVDIEELVLHGITPRDPHALRAAVAGELERLFASRELRWPHDRSRRVERLDGGAIPTSTRPATTPLAAQIARAVYTSVSR